MGDGQRADAAACAMPMFFLFAPALKLYLSRNLRGDLPSQTVSSDPACHMCGNTSASLTPDVHDHTHAEKRL